MENHRQLILDATTNAKPGSEAHTLRHLALDNLAQFDCCMKCKRVLNAELSCPNCGSTATTILRVPQVRDSVVGTASSEVVRLTPTRVSPRVDRSPKGRELGY